MFAREEGIINARCCRGSQGAGGGMETRALARNLFPLNEHSRFTITTRAVYDWTFVIKLRCEVSMLCTFS